MMDVLSLEWLDFSGEDAIAFTQEHVELPIFAVSAYLLVIFVLPQYLSQPYPLKHLNAAWNLLLAVFSICGATITVPYLMLVLETHGYRYTLCANPLQWYLSDRAGWWIHLFVYSKIPELLDTVFLVLQKKKVIFLHWFHHITVLLYCWHGHHQIIPTGIWFAAMNYTVHSVMYSYYFFMTFRQTRVLVKPIAPFITAIQILQMVVGVIVTVTSAKEYFSDRKNCHGNAANMKLGLAMYASYLVLFCILFQNLYIKKGKVTPMAHCPDVATPMNVNDGSGFFHDTTSGKADKKSD